MNSVTDPSLSPAIVRRLNTTSESFDADLAALLRFDTDDDSAVDVTAAAILADVRKRGDEALLEYTRRFDRYTITSVADLEVSRDEMEVARRRLPVVLREALEQAAERVRLFHERQRSESWSFEETDGTRLGQRVTPLDRVGIYVPGGLAAYPSSVLMNAIPAKVAGVAEVIMVTPTPGGVRSPMVLAAAAIAGVDRVFTIGGAQAIGALAYGTATIPAVDKIVGPGNAYVAAAKRRVFGTVGIDMIAGPSEILVVSDGTAPPEWVAMDLFSQAEHDEVAQAILLCPDTAYIDAVAASIAKMLPTLPRVAIVTASMRDRCALIRVRDLDEACAIVNRIAPEHLELSVADPDALLPKIRHAGAIFMGIYSSEALGDYCAGPNHVLPTARTARFSSPLGVYDFQRRSSVIRISKAGAQTLGRLAATLAHGEGLDAHARSAEMRIDGDASS
jgi:histidinol dehydrogenase